LLHNSVIIDLLVLGDVGSIEKEEVEELALVEAILSLMG
jgi:hypothetical protein